MKWQCPESVCYLISAFEAWHARNGVRRKRSGSPIQAAQNSSILRTAPQIQPNTEEVEENEEEETENKRGWRGWREIWRRRREEEEEEEEEKLGVIALDYGL